jgi:hypothetical protein
MIRLYYPEAGNYKVKLTGILTFIPLLLDKQNHHYC